MSDHPLTGFEAVPTIPDTLENVARAILTTPPKRTEDWAYLKQEKKREG